DSRSIDLAVPCCARHVGNVHHRYLHAVGLPGRRAYDGRRTDLLVLWRSELRKPSGTRASGEREIRRAAGGVATERSMSARSIIDVSKLPHHDFDTFDPV